MNAKDPKNMVKFQLQLAKIVGAPTGGKWSQVHSFIPAEPAKTSQRGQFLAVVSLGNLESGSGKPTRLEELEIEMVAAGREVIGRLHEEYYGDLTGSALECLEKAVKKVAAEVKSEAEIEIAAAAVIGEVLYLAIFGQGRLVLKRGEKLGTILGSEGTASGYLQEDDLFLLGTGRIFAVVAKGTLRAALLAGSPEETAEVLRPIIHAHTDGGDVAALIAQVKREGEIIARRLSPPAKAMKDLGRLKMCWQAINSWPVRISRRIRKEAIYLTEARKKKERSQKVVVTVALVLFILLGVSVILGTRQRKRLGEDKQITDLLQQAQAKQEEGKALLELNPSKARELLLAAQGLIQQVEPSGVTNPAVIEFKQELESLLVQVLREHQVVPGVYFDLELIKAGASGYDLGLSGEQAIIVDRGKAAVYSLGIEDKKSAILAGGQEFEGANQIASSLSKAFILTAKGVMEVDVATKKQRLAVQVDDEWGEIADLCTFGGNLYLLDKEGMIWKYSASEEGFGTKRRWLTSGEQTRFFDVVSMAIDGAIWVLKSDGTILKYVQGVQNAFGIAGLDKPFSDPAALYTDSEQEHLYLLDQGNSRVVVLAKSGEYEVSYFWQQGLEEVDNLVVSEEKGKIWLLGGSKIYEIGIK